MERSVHEALVSTVRVDKRRGKDVGERSQPNQQIDLFEGGGNGAGELERGCIMKVATVNAMVINSFIASSSPALLSIQHGSISDVSI